MVTETEALVPGLEPTAGHLQVMVLLPSTEKYILKTAVPVVVVTLVVPKMLIPALSVKEATQDPINAAVSSPLIVAVSVKSKNLVGVALDVTKVIE